MLRMISSAFLAGGFFESFDFLVELGYLRIDHVQALLQSVRS